MTPTQEQSLTLCTVEGRKDGAVTVGASRLTVAGVLATIRARGVPAAKVMWPQLTEQELAVLERLVGDLDARRSLDRALDEAVSAVETEDELTTGVARVDELTGRVARVRDNLRALFAAVEGLTLSRAERAALVDLAYLDDEMPAPVSERATAAGPGSRARYLAAVIKRVRGCDHA